MPEIDAGHIMMQKHMNGRKPDLYEEDPPHTPYEEEQMLYSCIENGDTDGLEKVFDSFIRQNVVVGRMSGNDLKQMQYFAVCCVALGTRAAIRGGLDEITAFDLSDRYIQTVDSISDIGRIPLFLSEKAFELTKLVRDSSFRKAWPAVVKKAVYCIGSGLYTKITAASAAEYCGVSKDHLNVLMKRYTGRTIGEYICAARLREAKHLLAVSMSISQTAYQLGFCSESYFISCYKKEYGVTPGKDR